MTSFHPNSVPASGDQCYSGELEQNASSAIFPSIQEFPYLAPSGESIVQLTVQAR